MRTLAAGMVPPGPCSLGRGDLEVADRLGGAGDDLPREAAVPRAGDDDGTDRLGLVAEVDVEVDGHGVGVPDLKALGTHGIGDQPRGAVGRSAWR